MTARTITLGGQPAMRVIGLISGTSFDAVEAVAVDFVLRDEVVRCRIVGSRSVPYPDPLRAAIAAILPPASTTIEEVCQLDSELGRFFAEIADSVREDECDGWIDAVASHGQTVFHWVRDGVALGTLQLGQPAYIAERTGATVVADIRARDLAAGGQGAPIVSLLDALLLGEVKDTVRGALNIGGIANMTVLSYGRAPLAFDIGPGNALIDAAVWGATAGAEAFDRDGARAAAGTVDPELLERLTAEPYYRLPPPKSTGKELFNAAYLDAAIAGRAIELDDLVATLTDLTARTISDAVAQHAVRELVVSGGGTRNAALMGALAGRLPGVVIRPTDVYGVPESAKEALVVALIGFLTLSGCPGIIPSATGARHTSVLGSITPGRTFDAAALRARDHRVVHGSPPRALVIVPAEPA